MRDLSLAWPAPTVLHKVWAKPAAKDWFAGAAAGVRHGCMQRVMLFPGPGCDEHQDRVGEPGVTTKALTLCVRRARAVMVQLGFYGHMKLALGAQNAALAPSRPLLFAVAFMLVFSAVIALFKDIPDVAGDRQARARACRPAPARLRGGRNARPHVTGGARAAGCHAVASRRPRGVALMLCGMPGHARAMQARTRVVTPSAPLVPSRRILSPLGKAPRASRPRAQEGVRTLSVRVGAPRVFWACIGMLEAAYLGAICMGLASQARPPGSALAGQCCS